MKKIFVILTVLSIFLLSGCGSQNESYAGDWYCSTDPDNEILVLYEDGKFSFDDAIGNYYVEDEEYILLEPTTAGYMSELLTISYYDGESCLIDEEGTYYFINYDAACEYSAKETENQEKAEQTAANTLATYLPGTWKKPEGENWLEFNEDGTYEYYFSDGWLAESGTWYVDFDNVKGYVMIYLESSKGKTEDLGIQPVYVQNNDYLEKYKDEWSLPYPYLGYIKAE